jgi:hypothetical protein
MNIGNITIPRKIVLVVFGILSLLLLIALITQQTSKKTPTLDVLSDTNGVQLEVGDQKYTLHNGAQKISLAKQVYTYRATAVVDGKKIVIVDKADLVQNTSVSIKLHFSIYSSSHVADVLCEQTGQGCLTAQDTLSLQFLENDQWAVAVLTNPVSGITKAVLKVSNGEWQVVAGPGSDIPNDGYYPESVEEALDAQ